jgi:hypothetical protein
MRKGFAFPGQMSAVSPHPRRLEGDAFGGADEVDESSRQRKGVAFVAAATGAAGHNWPGESYFGQVRAQARRYDTSAVVARIS